MTTTQTNAPQPLLSTGARIAAALAVAACLAGAWAAGEHESQRAVQIASASIGGPQHVTLPDVEIVGQRLKSGDAVAAAATGRNEL